ncbi:hypothetical protein Adt_35447 [Abeliophyllum distichum]|uniref:Uncharacterized protein n=1 Tax=Abeliophyllum distichum TaxID=126358 RepID=A0ABD1QER5_9LAMI
MCSGKSFYLKLGPHRRQKLPLPSGLGHLAAHSSQGTRLAQGPLPLGLGHLAARSFQGTMPRSRASPTRTRPPSGTFLPRNDGLAQGPLPLGLNHLAARSLGGTSLLKGLSHRDSTTYRLVPPKE